MLPIAVPLKVFCLLELAEEEQADVSPKRSNFLTRLAEYFTPENAENPSDKEATNNT